MALYVFIYVFIKNVVSASIMGKRAESKRKEK